MMQPVIEAEGIGLVSLTQEEAMYERPKQLLSEVSD